MGQGRAALRNHRAAFGGDAGGQRAQIGIEGHHLALARLAVEQRPFRHGQAEHLLKAQGLGAKLHLVGPVRLGAAPLVFDRIWRGPVELDRIGLA